MSTLPSLVVFGSIASWPDEDQLQQLITDLQQNTTLGPIVATMRDLPLLWQKIATQDSILDVVPGKVAAEKLRRVAVGEVEVNISSWQQNMMTLPITVVIHTIQYLKYLESTEVPGDHSSLLRSVSAGGGIQGFCAGLLSALAVASGTTKEEVAELAATSVNLAFCIGAYVDLDQMKHGDISRSSNLAIRLKAPMTQDDIQKMLLDYTDVSSVHDCPDI